MEFSTSSTKSRTSPSLRPTQQQQQQQSSSSAIKLEITPNMTRKEKVAIWSRLRRERKNKEFVDLRSENDRLRSERNDLLTHYMTLQDEVQRDEVSAALAVENDLLRSQVSQHELFVRSVMAMMSEEQPSTLGVARSVAEQTLDFMWDKLQRLLAQSQTSSQWTPPKRVPMDLAQRNMACCIRSELLQDGTRNIRVEGLALMPKSLSTKEVCERYALTWSDPSKFAAIWNDASLSSTPSFPSLETRELSDFAFQVPPASDGSAMEGLSISAVMMRERITDETQPGPSVFDWVFLTGSRRDLLPVSTLWHGTSSELLLKAQLAGGGYPDVGNPLSSTSCATSMASPAIIPSSSSSSTLLPLRSASSSASIFASSSSSDVGVERATKRIVLESDTNHHQQDVEVPVGTADVCTLMRVSTRHDFEGSSLNDYFKEGESPKQENELDVASTQDFASLVEPQPVRITFRFEERYLVWKEDVQLADGREFSRFWTNTVLTVPPDFRFSLLGHGSMAFVEEDGGPTQRFAKVVERYMQVLFYPT